MAMRIAFIILFLSLVASCSPLETLPAPPTPQIISIHITPTLRPLTNTIQDCEQQHPDIAVVIEERPATALEFEADTITIGLDTPPEGIPKFTYPIGFEKIIFIAGSNFPRVRLTADKLQQLYSSPNSGYQLWGYPPGNELNQIFEQVVLSELEAAPQIQIAPEPGAMLSAIEANPDAIGYLPESWVNVSELSNDWVISSK